jgi:murein DD-endopeptidase MepM/ murein hydrolase activator NlpD
VRRIALVLLLLALLAFGSADAQGPAAKPGASASALAIRVIAPGAGGASTSVASPPNAPAATGSFAYPADGSIASAQSTTASAVTAVPLNASAKASSTVTGLSLFGGEITADAVTASASAGTGPSGAGGNALGSAVTNVKITGQPFTGSSATLGDWGTLTVGSQSTDRNAPAGTEGYHGTVIELDIKLTADHGGLPASSEIQIGTVDVRVQTAPRPQSTTTTTTTTTTAAPPVTTVTPSVGDLPSERPPETGSPGAVPLKVEPKLTAGHYVFPVYGASSYTDTFGAPRADVTYHHGDDIFGQLGQPIIACADGTLFSVGYEKIGGNRLWLRDSQGNQFYYAHLSAYAASTTNGARVKAGQVIGFMGNTGDAEGTPVHLHFEIHPVSLLYLGYDGAVDPTPYLDAWKHQQDLAFPIGVGWAPLVAGGHGGPEPGAILLGMRDISTANGLDPASLERALAPLKRSDLMQTIVPAAPAPSKRAQLPPFAPAGG